MAFNLERFFDDVFKPTKGEVVTLMVDLPNGTIADRKEWQERRTMANDWHQKLTTLATTWGVTVNPIVTYAATGKNNADLPTTGTMNGKEVKLADVITNSTIIVAMPEFSATAPLFMAAKQSKKLRVGSMPGVAKFMEESGLAADYKLIAERCKILQPIFNKAVKAEVEFSSGHKCTFDLSHKHHAHIDDGFLHPEVGGTERCLSNLPAGEVYVVPNEAATSTTSGELPHRVGNDTLVYIVQNNRIVDVKGTGPKVAEMKAKFTADRAWQNIGEFAIGCNEKARVTGVVLEDEKAGFHWAYGRSDHLGGTVGVKDFTAPTNVVHQDIVYAKNSPISCTKLDVIFPDNTRKTLIKNGDLLI